MRISRIYYNGMLKRSAEIRLADESSHYLINVLRLKVGDVIVLFNGDGQDYPAQIVTIHKKQVLVTTLEERAKNVESPLRIHLAQSISRGDKMDWTIQKAVELGVTQITPIMSEFSSVKLDAQRSAKRLLHWQKIITHACEQSGRSCIPILKPVNAFKSWVGTVSSKSKLFCHPGMGQNISQLAINTEATLLIGPEGGWSDEEVQLAKAHNFVGISLGPRILRTETAGMVAISLLQGYWGDLGGLSKGQ